MPFWTTAWVQHDPETAPRGRKGRIIAHLWRTMAAKLALEILSMISFGYKRRCDSRKPRALHGFWPLFGRNIAGTCSCACARHHHTSMIINSHNRNNSIIIIISNNNNNS